jgi:polysaccharide biosynthesis protein PslH
MRVLFLSQIVPYPPHGGVLQRGYHLLRHLGRDARVHLLAFVHPDVLPTPTAIEDSRRALQEYCEHVEYFPLWAKGSAVKRALALGVSAASTRPFSVIAHQSAAFQRRVSESLRSIPFDLIHVDTLALCQFVDAKRAIAAVLTHHNIESLLMQRRAQVEAGSARGRFLQREAHKLTAYEKLVSPAFDVNVMVSEPDETVLRQMVPGVRTAVVPNGVDIGYFTPKPEEETPALIYAGGMNMFANRDAVMHFLNEIWPAVRECAPDVRFFAVGQDPPRELVAYAASDPRVVVTGYVDDVRPYVWKAAVYVVPLRVGGGTRLKVLDAMAMGKAIVSTSIGCEGIAVRQGEHLEIADDRETFARTTLQLLGDRVRRLALGRSARALVERDYAWDVIDGRLRAAYRRAVASR